MTYTEQLQKMSNIEIIHKRGTPYGIRDENGFLFFFPEISKYTRQEERYRQEIEEQHKLADYLLSVLSRMEQPTDCDTYQDIMSRLKDLTLFINGDRIEVKLFGNDGHDNQEELNGEEYLTSHITNLVNSALEYSSKEQPTDEGLKDLLQNPEIRDKHGMNFFLSDANILPNGDMTSFLYGAKKYHDYLEIKISKLLDQPSQEKELREALEKVSKAYLQGMIHSVEWDKLAKVMNVIATKALER